MDSQPERASGAPVRGGPHGAYAAVMATGIVSVAAAEDGIAWLSWGLAAVAACLYVALAPRAVRCLRVGVESFAVVAVLADRRLAPAGLVLFGLGLALYVQRASGLEPGELLRSDGEVWVAMGAL